MTVVDKVNNENNSKPVKLENSRFSLNTPRTQCTCKTMSFFTDILSLVFRSRSPIRERVQSTYFCSIIIAIIIDCFFFFCPHVNVYIVIIFIYISTVLVVLEFEPPPSYVARDYCFRWWACNAIIGSEGESHEWAFSSPSPSPGLTSKQTQTTFLIPPPLVV